MLSRGFAKYLVLQIPEGIVAGLLIFWAQAWLEWPLWSAFLALGLWIGKDLAMYPFVRKVFEEDLVARAGVGLLIGQSAITEDELAPSGYVRVKGELWRAEVHVGSGQISRGERVKVCEVRGLTLVVKALVEATD
ncbi:MAG: hypothetical protein GY725_23735 [bacterium]|nr:hypothetical protein [bacterium]